MIAKRRAQVLAAAALLAAAAMAKEDAPRVGSAVRFGVAPRVEELMQLHVPPVTFGGEREVENRRVEALDWRGPVVTREDPLAMGFTSRLAPTAMVSFGGYDSDDNNTLFGFRIMPPDTEGDVGLGHYVQYNNLGWKFWDKATQTENGPFPGNIFWMTFGGVCQSDNAGDPIVLYDQFADRWIFSQFTDPANPSGHQCFAVTQGNTPAGPYFLYEFEVSPGQFNDYPKIGVWTDADGGQSAYHMTSNEFASGFVGVNATAFDRDAMLAGNPGAGFVQFSLPVFSGSLQNFSLQPSHLEGNVPPPATTCNEYIMAFDDDVFGTGTGPDGYRFWTYCVDFTTPANSSFTPGPLVMAPEFDAELCGFSEDCIPQPGTTQGLDALGQFTMYRFGTRYLPGVGVRGAVSHTVDTGANLAGVRWALIDVDNHAILDSGTLAPGDGVNRWTPSATLDSAGNLGLTYSRGNAAASPSVYFTGRETTDPPGTLQMESVCINGTGSQTGGGRWGDYAAISIDPEDDCTFWLTNEYVETTGSFRWDTQVCAFKFESCGCPASLVVDNVTIEGTETYGALVEVTVGPSVTVPSGANLVLKSAGRVTFVSPVTVATSGSMRVEITPDPCAP